MTDPSMTWGQNTYAQPTWGTPQFCGCDACGTSMSNDWTAGGWYYDSVDQGSTGCGCGEQYSADSSMYVPEGNDVYEYSAESPTINVPQHNQYNQGNPGSRTFPPSAPGGHPAAPNSEGHQKPEPAPKAPSKHEAVPMPQDMTPMDPPMEFPGGESDGFDPGENGAPAADNILDPVSYEIPRLPPIPERAHSSSRGVTQHQVRPIEIHPMQFHR